MSIIPYVFINLLYFYSLPLLIKDTGSGMFVLLLIIPLLLAIISFIYGFKNQKHNFLYSIVTTISFIPAILIYFNYTALIYLLLYFVITILFNYTGKAFKRVIFK